MWDMEGFDGWVWRRCLIITPQSRGRRTIWAIYLHHSVGSMIYYLLLMKCRDEWTGTARGDRVIQPRVGYAPQNIALVGKGGRGQWTWTWVSGYWCGQLLWTHKDGQWLLKSVDIAWTAMWTKNGAIDEWCMYEIYIFSHLSTLVI